MLFLELPNLSIHPTVSELFIHHRRCSLSLRFVKALSAAVNVLFFLSSSWARTLRLHADGPPPMLAIDLSVA